MLLVGAGACDDSSEALDASTSPVTNDASAGGTSGTSGAGGASGAGGTLGAAGSTGAGGSTGSGGTLDAGGDRDAGAVSSDGGGAGTGGGAEGGSAAPGACTREGLKALVDQYFSALAAHNPSMLPLAPSAKYTENGQLVNIGEGAWKTAGALKFKRSAIDTQICTSVTESVIDNEYSGGGSGGFLGGLFGGGGTGGGGSSTSARVDFVYGLRLKLDSEKISEIETILVSPDGWFPDPQAVIAAGSDDWETVLPEDKRATRDELKKIVDDYFKLFSGGDLNAFPFASDCARLENGFSPGACNFGIMGLGAGMTPRLYVLDVEASIAVGFVMFAGSFADFHMFKVRDDQVHGVHAVLAAAGSSGWN